MQTSKNYQAETDLLGRLAYVNVVFDYYKNLRGLTFGSKPNILYRALNEYAEIVGLTGTSLDLPVLNRLADNLDTVKCIQKIAARIAAGRKWTPGLKGDISIIWFHIDNYLNDLRYAQFNNDHHFKMDEIQAAAVEEFNKELRFASR